MLHAYYSLSELSMPEESPAARFSQQSITYTLLILLLLCTPVLMASTSLEFASDTGDCMPSDTNMADTPDDSDGFDIADFNPASSITLSVDWLNFQAYCDKDAVVLSWATAAELNNEGFSVQRGLEHDGIITWTEIAYLRGQGTTHERNDYEVSDTDPEAGTNYYRVTQIDFNGTSTSTAIQKVHIQSSSVGDFALYPNPAIGQINVEREAESQATGYQLFNGNGTLVDQGVLAAGFVQSIDVNELTAGTYFLRVGTGEDTTVQSFVKTY